MQKNQYQKCYKMIYNIPISGDTDFWEPAAVTNFDCSPSQKKQIPFLGQTEHNSDPLHHTLAC